MQFGMNLSNEFASIIPADRPPLPNDPTAQFPEHIIKVLNQAWLPGKYMFLASNFIIVLWL
jgi:hypothetical protein